MSSKTYNLQVRTRTSIANQSSPAQHIPLSPEPVSYADNDGIAASAAVPNVDTNVTTALRTYSDVVALRPPSPRREKPVTPTERPIVGDSGDKEHTTTTYHCVDSSNQLNKMNDTSSNNSEESESQENNTWITVKRRRARSMSSLERTRKLTGEQKQTVKEASKRLTHEQKKQIHRRQEKVQARRDGSISLRGEGPSQPKGKTIDLREWGNANLSTESLDIEAQTAAFNSIKA